MATRRASTSRKKTARKKGKPLRQSWRDLVSWWTRQKVASAKRATQKVSDGKARVKAAEDKAKAKAEEDKLAAVKRAQGDAEKAARDATRAARRAQQQAAATQRAQQRAAQRGPVTVGGTITATGQTGSATLCGHPHITDPRQKCGNPVLPGTPTCAAGHPQGGSSFGGPRPSQIVNQHTPQFGAAARGNP